MSRVLVTGDRGRLGRDVVPALERAGHEVRGFDVADGDDLLDAAAVADAVAGCDVVVHLAGITEDRDAPAADVFAVNVTGTWNVLQAARAAEVERVVLASSGKALGMLWRRPRYLPMDDEHPGAPLRPYGLSKWACEEMCEAFTAETGIATICLRPVLVLDERRWAQVGPGPELPPARGTTWHLGAFVDQRDTVEAFALAVACPDPGHVRLLLCADEVGSERPTVALADEHFPGVPWRGERPAPDARTALVDCAAARRVLGWRPTCGWSDRPTLVR